MVSIVLNEGRLDWVHVLRTSEALDGGDLHVLLHCCEEEAAIRPFPIDVDRARSTLPVIAALLSAGQVQGFSKRIENGRPRINLYPVRRSVHLQRDRDGLGRCNCAS